MSVEAAELTKLEDEALEHAVAAEAIVARITARSAEIRPFVLIGFGSLCVLHGKKFEHVLLFVQSFMQRGLPSVMRRVAAFSQSYAESKAGVVATFARRRARRAAEHGVVVGDGGDVAAAAAAPAAAARHPLADGHGRRLSTMVRLKTQMHHLASDLRQRSRRAAIMELAASLLTPKLIVDVVLACYTATMSAIVSCMSAGAARFSLGTTLGRFIAIHVKHRATQLWGRVEERGVECGNSSGGASRECDHADSSRRRAPSAVSILLRRWVGAASGAACAGLGLLCAWKSERIVSTMCTCYIGANALCTPLDGSRRVAPASRTAGGSLRERGSSRRLARERRAAAPRAAQSRSSRRWGSSAREVAADGWRVAPAVRGAAAAKLRAVPTTQRSGPSSAAATQQRQSPRRVVRSAAATARRRSQQRRSSECTSECTSGCTPEAEVAAAAMLCRLAVERMLLPRRRAMRRESVSPVAAPAMVPATVSATTSAARQARPTGRSLPPTAWGRRLYRTRSSSIFRRALRPMLPPPPRRRPP